MEREQGVVNIKMLSNLGGRWKATAARRWISKGTLGECGGVTTVVRLLVLYLATFNFLNCCPGQLLLNPN